MELGVHGSNKCFNLSILALFKTPLTRDVFFNSQLRTAMFVYSFAGHVSARSNIEFEPRVVIGFDEDLSVNGSMSDLSDLDDSILSFDWHRVLEGSSLQTLVLWLLGTNDDQLRILEEVGSESGASATVSLLRAKEAMSLRRFESASDHYRDVFDAQRSKI